MSPSTRCLLDKVAARRTLEGLLKLAQGRDTSMEELWAIDLLQQAQSQDIQLFVTGETVNILQQISALPHYATIIAAFLKRTEEARPTRYFKRWARRLREFGFTPEDAHILALATFGTSREQNILSIHLVATYDRALVNQWTLHHDQIRERWKTMLRDLQPPYDQTILPQVLRPEQVLPWASSQQ